MSSVNTLRLTLLQVTTAAFFISLQFDPINAHGGDSSTHHSSEGDLNSRSLILVKIGCLLIFFFSTFGFGISPYFFKWNDSFLLLGTQFAAGIFLGTSLMHFLADSNSTFESLTEREYPFAYMLACAGYLLTMLGDCIISRITKRSTVEMEVEGEKRLDVEQGREEEHHNPYFLRTTSVGDTFLLIIALCFHSVFEGIAVGVSGSEADAWRNLWTISLHKVFAAVAMGIALLKMLPKRPFIAILGYSFAFAISSPVGIGIGIGIDSTTEGRVADWIFAISMGFACGIFIYVSINHLIAKGYKPRSPSYFDTPLFKFLAVFVGVAVMAVVMTWD